MLPTGGGKSLTYQLSAILEPGVTLVVDPLISLMVDQERGLKDLRIDFCACVNSTMDSKEKYCHLRELQDGNLLFILLSPERFMMENFRESLVVMSKHNGVYFSFGVIDEVHCVSEWGHDFRPAYLHLGRNMMKFMNTQDGDNVPIIGLTATASFDVLADVERELTLGDLMTIDSDTIVRPEEDERKELTYKIVEVKAEFDSLKKDKNNPYVLAVTSGKRIRKCVSEAKKETLLSLLSLIPKDIERVNEQHNPEIKLSDFDVSHFYKKDSNNVYQNAGIIFCPHAHGYLGVEDSVYPTFILHGITSFLSSNADSLEIGTFIGSDKNIVDEKAFNEKKFKAMSDFNLGKINVMVATKAFGMGIDKPNVRYTININHPSSIESFVQEAGRAGRDKKNAISYLLFEPTQFIVLTEDKILAFKNVIGLPAIVPWMSNNRNKYILKKDFRNFLCSNGVSQEKTDAVIKYSENHDFFENDDKDVELWFHNNSFKGALKERYILSELTHNLLNSTTKDGTTVSNTGIYSAIAGIRNATYAYVVVTWENQIEKDFNIYQQNIDNAIIQIANSQNWNAALPGKKDLENVGDFMQLLRLIFNMSQDSNWISNYNSSKKSYDIYEPLMHAFYQRRDKDDTDKAIYRLCCIGIIEDVIIDYNSETYTLKIYKKNDDDYLNTMRHYFRKYFSNIQADEKIEEIKEYEGNDILEKCINYLTEFTYCTLERKRYRAIEDMRLACIQGELKGENWLKNFIHLYFNSKYAREGYKIGGIDYSLQQDISNTGDEDTYKIVKKYINAVYIDQTGSTIDNVKHLYGATLLVLRSYPNNIALNLLRTFCLVFLGMGCNETLKRDAYESYLEGFSMLEKKIRNGVFPLIIDFHQTLIKVARDNYVKKYFNKKNNEILVVIHGCRLENFKGRYLKDW